MLVGIAWTAVGLATSPDRRCRWAVSGQSVWGLVALLVWAGAAVAQGVWPAVPRVAVYVGALPAVIRGLLLWRRQRRLPLEQLSPMAASTRSLPSVADPQTWRHPVRSAVALARVVAAFPALIGAERRWQQDQAARAAAAP